MINKMYLTLVMIFLLALFVKSAPLLEGHTVPYGWVDTTSHMSAGLDISEGDLGSLIHPWWHVKNHFLVSGYDIVDKNSASFFYPPLIDLTLAAGFMFTHPGIATIIIISLLYSLSVFSVFFLCRSFKMDSISCLFAAAIVALSVPLLQSQNFGFWTFVIALNLLILFFAFLRMGNIKHAAVFGFISCMTHWLFVIPVIGLAILHYKQKGIALSYVKYTVIPLIPLWFILFITWNPLTYVTTHVDQLFYFNYIIGSLAIVSAILFWKDYKIISAVSALILFFVVIFYSGILIPFGDMMQFTFPYIIGFFSAALLTKLKGRMKNIVIVVILVSLAYNISLIAHIHTTTETSITNEQFDSILEIREIPVESKGVLMINQDLAPWITLASKNNRILYPFSYEGEDMHEYYVNYIRGEVSEDLIFYEIDAKGTGLKIILPPDSYFWKTNGYYGK